MRPLQVQYLGRLEYNFALNLQRELAEKRKAGDIEDTLLLLEHDPVVTVGRNGGRESVLGSADLFKKNGVSLLESDRGGDATYHGPGQLVGYVIMDLRPDRKDLRRYVRTLEEVMIRTVADYGLSAGRVADAPGAWLTEPDRKIGAIGARVSRWVTHHGFALNVNTNLAHFDLIVPCGIPDKGVTSMARELGRRFSMVDVMEGVVRHMAQLFERTVSDDPSEWHR